jgi:hypothetical protein
MHRKHRARRGNKGDSRQNPRVVARPGLVRLPAPLLFLPRHTGLGLLAVCAGAIGLAFTNPGPEDYEEFAGERLSAALIEELCEPDGLPMVLRLIIRDCPGVIRSQRSVLGRLAGSRTRRRNLGVFSVYRTDLGGQALLGSWQLPHYQTLTLAAAGQFVLLRTDRLRREDP